MIKRFFLIIFALVCFCTISASSGKDPEVVAKHVRAFIKKGNEAYRNKQYAQAETYYKDALQEDPNSELAQFNLALALLRQQSAVASDTLRQMSKSYFHSVTENPAADHTIIEKAFYNLGNIAFDEKDYAGSIEMYKEVLRKNPANIKARQNLRVAQIKLKEQQQNNQGQDNQQDDQKKENKDQKDKQDKQNQQDKQQQNQQDKDKNKDNKNQQTQPQNKKPDEQPMDEKNNGGAANRPEISKENADKILKAAAKQEEQTRKKIEKNKNENTQRRIIGNPW